MRKVKVKIVRPTVANGEPVDVDQEVEVEAADARLLMRLKKAVPASPGATALLRTGTSPETADDEDVDEAETATDPATKRVAKK